MLPLHLIHSESIPPAMAARSGLLQNARVLISGASVAGPALALWLNRYGFEITVVEKAPEVRRGGLAVDFKGATHKTVLQRMGIWDDIHAARAPSAGDGAIVDAAGRRIATMPAEFSGGDVEIARGDLAHIVYSRTAAKCEYMFGDSIASLKETADGAVDVRFESAAPRAFDLVVGADGIHSNVRRLAFGPEADYVRHLGYCYALAGGIGGGGDDLMYNEPGRMAATGGAEDPAWFVFASEPLDYERDDVKRQKQHLIDAYRGGAWRIPELMAAIPGARDFYMDSVSRVTMNQYSKGRVALLGDAAYGNTLGGCGTGLAVVGAYVLAGELHRANGDHKVAFAEYQKHMGTYARVSQQVNAGKFLAPSTRFGMYVRNQMMSVATLFKGVMMFTDYFATDTKLEDYASGR